MTLPTIPDFNVRWLTDPAIAGTTAIMPATPVLQRLDYPIPPHLGRGWLERLPLAHGVHLIHGVYRSQPGAIGQLMPLMEFNYTFPAPTLVIQTIKGGTICHQERYPPAELIYKPGYDLFRRADRFELIPLVDTTTDCEMTALFVTEMVLTELLGVDLAEMLITRLGLESPPVVRVLPIPISVSAPLRTALSAQLQGSLQKLFAQARVLEYLCALATHTVAYQPARPPYPRQPNQVQELHDYLTQLQGKLPTLEELARQFGMSARRLNEEFAREYGLSIYAFISERRLNEAYVAIRDSNIALKTLAERLGYAHVNNFNAAFKKKFGQPPGQLQRRRQAK